MHLLFYLCLQSSLITDEVQLAAARLLSELPLKQLSRQEIRDLSVAVMALSAVRVRCLVASLSAAGSFAALCAPFVSCLVHACSCWLQTPRTPTHYFTLSRVLFLLFRLATVVGRWPLSLPWDQASHTARLPVCAERGGLRDPGLRAGAAIRARCRDGELHPSLSKSVCRTHSLLLVCFDSC